MTASLTGQFSRQGTQALEGALAWARDANLAGGIYVASAGRRLSVEIKHYDDQSKAHVTAALYEKLVLADGVDLLLGPYSSVLTAAAAPVAERFQRVLWNQGGAADAIHQRGSRFIVGVLTPASRYFEGVLEMVREREPGTPRVAFLYSARGAFPQTVVSGAESYALRRGFEVVFKGHYQPPAPDLSQTLAEIEDAAPDVVLGVGRVQDDLSLARQLAGLPTRAKAIGLVAAGIQQFGDELADAATGFMGPSQWEPETACTPDYGPPASELARNHRMFAAERGDYPLAQAYAGGLVAQRCVEEAGTLDNLALREAASRLRFATFFGPFRIDPATGCQVGKSAVVVQWQGGGKMVVRPGVPGGRELLYPRRPGPGL